MDIELYEFRGQADIYRLTPHEHDVGLDPGGYGYATETYQSAPIERGPVAFGSDASKAALELRIPSSHEIVQILLAASLRGETVSVRHMVASFVEAIELNRPWVLNDISTLWMGRVLGVEASDDAARIRCEPVHVSMKRIGLRRLYSRACSHVLYSRECGAAPIYETATVQQVSGQYVLLDAVSPTFEQAVIGGWLQTAGGQRYMITDFSTWFSYALPPGPTVALLTPAELQTGDEVRLYAGCDHSMQTCSSRFNNLDNFGGFPFIPSKNPFSSPVY
ncbi:MAG: phage BR0599 family protein [Hylemonella sp.]